MARTKKHKDVEFSVLDGQGDERIFDTFGEAAGFVLTQAVSDGKWHNLNVLIYSAAGAQWWGGDDAAEQYREDPEASVSQRIVVKATDEGRIA